MPEDSFEPFFEEGHLVEHVLEVRLSGADLASLDLLAEARGMRTDEVIAAAVRSYANQRRFAEAGATLEQFAGRVQRLPRSAAADSASLTLKPWQDAGLLLAGT